MTLYEGEDDVCISSAEPDCFYSSIQRTQRPPERGPMGDRKLSCNHPGGILGNSQPSLPQTTVQDPIHIDEDAESSLGNIIEQLDSFDILDHTRGVSGANSGRQARAPVCNGAQEHVHEFQRVYVQNSDGDTLLHLAIIDLQVRFALHFIDISPSNTWLNLRNHLYQTALHLAVLTKQDYVIRRLVVGGADIESRDKFGNTPLHIACKEGYIDGVRLLLKPVRYEEIKQNTYDIPYQRIPQDLELKNYDGLSALHLAATNGHLDIVQVLLEKHANVNSRDVKSGQSILHKACSAGNLDLVRFLLKCRQCDINLKTYDNYTPFDFARARSNERITYELAAAGAQLANENEEYD